MTRLRKSPVYCRIHQCQLQIDRRYDDRRRYDGAPAPLGHAQAFPSAPELYPSLNSLAIDGAYPPPPRAQSPAPSGLARNFST